MTRPPATRTVAAVPGRPGIPLALGLLALYSWWATGLETFSAASTMAVVGGGAAGIAWGTWQRRRLSPGGRNDRRDRSDALWSLSRSRGETREDGPRRRRPGLAVWLALLSALAALQMAMYTRGPRDDYPTISSIINSLLDTHGARTVAYAAWVFGAARLARRPPGAREEPLVRTRS